MDAKEQVISLPPVRFWGLDPLFWTHIKMFVKDVYELHECADYRGEEIILLFYLRSCIVSLSDLMLQKTPYLRKKQTVFYVCFHCFSFVFFLLQSAVLPGQWSGIIFCFRFQILYDKYSCQRRLTYDHATYN